MSESVWKTCIEETENLLSGSFKFPQQMLAEQEYDGHLSIHDNAQAESLGFKGAPIEGPTHFRNLILCCINYGEMTGLDLVV